MKNILSAALIVALFAGSAYADEAKEAGAKLVADLSSAEGLVGTTNLGFYFGNKRIGQVAVVVEKNSEGYKQSATMQFAFGPTKSKNTQVIQHDAKLGLVSSKEVKLENKGGAETTETITITREGGEYVRTVVKGEAKPFVTRFKTDQVCYDDALILVAQVAAKTPGKYAFEGIKWPTEEAVAGGEAPVWRVLSLESREATEYTHRGKAVQAATVTGTKGEEGKESMQFRVAAKGAILLMAPKDAPVKMIAGTMEEIGKDLASETKVKDTKAGNGANSTPLGAVGVYFKVLSGEGKIDELDSVMDWVAIHAAASKTNPEVAGFDPQAFGELVKGQLKSTIPVLPPEQVKMILGMLSEKVEGDDATVNMPGNKMIKLKKSDAGWKITELPS